VDVDSGNIFPRNKVGRDRSMRTMMRQGTVIDRKHDKKQGPLVRIQYPDKQNLISKWIPVKQTGARSTSHYYCPKIGDNVNVTMLPTGNEDGFVDGSFFNQNNPPPEDIDLNTRQFQTEDGTIIEYRESDSTLNIKAAGPIVISGDIQHTGNMTTSGVHTDSNGVHMGGGASAELEERIRRLEERVSTLEARL
jgi:phage baseplate assembly protein V